MEEFKKLEDEVINSILSLDKLTIEKAFVNEKLILEEKEENEFEEDSLYKGNIEGIATKEEFDNMQYLGQRAIQFLEDIAGHREKLTFEQYFSYYNSHNKKNNFKNIMYRLKSKNVFSINSLNEICECIGYYIEIHAKEVKDLSLLRSYKKGRKAYHGNIHFNLKDDVEYPYYTKEFFEFLNILGEEGYTFENLFGELEYNSNDKDAVSKLKSALDKAVKQGKLTWKTMEQVANNIGFELEIEFKKMNIDGNRINTFDFERQLHFNRDPKSNLIKDNLNNPNTN